jgi:hypothetical protein
VGSRDPLGVQPIWTRLGRTCVANLTTVSTSVRNFKVLLLGCYFARCAADERGVEEELPTFLRWEQLAAYARALVLKETGFRGIERVQQRLARGETIRLGTSESEQILSDQKTYGLWGTYRVPAEASSLIEREPLRLTPEAREVVERVYLPTLARAGGGEARAILECVLTEGKTLRKGNAIHERILKAVSSALERVDPREADLFRRHLLHGGPRDADPEQGTRGRQRLLAELLEDTLPLGEDWQVTPVTLRALARQADRRGETGADLGRHLEQIRSCEALLAPAVELFVHTLGSTGQSLGTLGRNLRKSWGTALQKTLELAATVELGPYLRTNADDPGSARRWLDLARALHDGKYERAFELLLDQNAAVMKARHAAPWCRIESGKLRIDYAEDVDGALPSRGELPQLWRHAYFLQSLRTVAQQLHG